MALPFTKMSMLTLRMFGAVAVVLLIVSSGFARELGALCSAAKDFVSAAKAQEGILITYPTASELAASTLAYAVAKKRYFSELRSALPILIVIGLKERPKTSEVANASNGEWPVAHACSASARANSHAPNDE